MKDFRRNFIVNDHPDLFSKLHKKTNALLLSFSEQNRLNLSDEDQIDSLIEKLSELNEEGESEIINEVMLNLCSGALNWYSPKLHYNIGAPINCYAYFAYSYALSHNIFTVNDGLSGNTLVAEKAVVNIMKKISHSDELLGWFTFGGTGVNLYAAKVGIKKANPEAAKKGVGNNTIFLTTKNSHFSHFVAADWLGIGTDNVHYMKSNCDGTTSVEDFSSMLEYHIINGSQIGCIYLNGGTSYNHVIDEIEKFILIRDEIVKKYNLDYSPHIHVDSVIGWFWLFFSDYDFSANELQIKSTSLTKIQEQYKRISQVKYADSWGVDFHKGIGGCPVNSSLFLLNSVKDKLLLSKKMDCSIKMHQIAEEFSIDSPVDFTLENSRSAGPMLSAIASLLSTGKNGFRSYLSMLISVADELRLLVSEYDDIYLCDNYGLGFVIMMRCYPPTYLTNLSISPRDDNIIEFNNSLSRADIEEVNNYNKNLFKFIMLKKNKIEFSYSSSFLSRDDGVNIHAMKIYLISPFLEKENAKEILDFIAVEKKIYDNRPK